MTHLRQLRILSQIPEGASAGPEVGWPQTVPGAKLAAPTRYRPGGRAELWMLDQSPSSLTTKEPSNESPGFPSCPSFSFVVSVCYRTLPDRNPGHGRGADKTIRRSSRRQGRACPARREYAGKCLASLSRNRVRQAGSGALFLANKRFGRNPLARPVQMPANRATANLPPPCRKIIYLL